MLFARCFFNVYAECTMCKYALVHVNSTTACICEGSSSSKRGCCLTTVFMLLCFDAFGYATRLIRPFGRRGTRGDYRRLTMSRTRSLVYALPTEAPEHSGAYDVERPVAVIVV